MRKCSHWLHFFCTEFNQPKINMSELLVLILFALVATYLWASVKAKEIAIRAGHQACEQKKLQFLDQTVEQRSVRPGLDSRNNPCWIRKYHFEFATDGELRYGGQLVMQGHRVSSLNLDPYPETIIEPISFTTKL